MAEKAARIVFMGSPDFATPALRQLAARYDVCAVYTQPARRKGRGMKEIPTAVALTAQSLNIPCFSPESLRHQSEIDRLKAFHADLFIVVAYGQILSREILDIPEYGCVNAHASLLPRWRGAAPIQRAIEAGDSVTGICAMMMAEGLDTGPVINSTSIEITQKMTAGQLHDALAAIAPQNLCDATDALIQGNANFCEQDEQHATYAAKISTKEACLNLEDDAEHIARRICAFSPYPGAYIHTVSGRLKLLSAYAYRTANSQQPGIFTGRDKNGDMLLSCAGGMLVIDKVQLAGKKPMGIADFLNGQSWQAGQAVLAPAPVS